VARAAQYAEVGGGTVATRVRLSWEMLLLSVYAPGWWHGGHVLKERLDTTLKMMNEMPHELEMQVPPLVKEGFNGVLNLEGDYFSGDGFFPFTAGGPPG